MNSHWKMPCIKSDLLMKCRLEQCMPNYKWSRACCSIRSSYESYLRAKGITKKQRDLRARRLAAAVKREKEKGKEDDIEGKKHNEAVGAGEKKREAKKGAVNNFDLIGEGEGKEGEGADDIEAKKHNEAVGAGEKKREAKKGAVNNFDLIGEGEGKEGEGAVDNSGPRSLRVTKKSNHKRAKNPEETPKKKMR